MALGILTPAPVALKLFKISNTLNLMFTSALGAFLGRLLGFLKVTTVLFQREFCTPVTCPWSRTAKLPSSNKSRKFSPCWTNSRLISPSSTHSLSTSESSQHPNSPSSNSVHGLYKFTSLELKMYYSVWIINIEIECIHSMVCTETSRHMA